jgi:ethanolamine utilization microcompartment shell protein EutS
MNVFDYAAQRYGKTTRTILGRLPARFRWTAHNLVAHPFSELLFQIGLENAGNVIHDITIPDHTPGEGRG